jgi:two-component system cell cycle response regulator DivK
MPGLVAVVDDNVDNMKLFRAVLARHGHVVVAFDTGVGLARVIAEADAKPDLVLLDIQLPDLDGFEVLAELRAVCDPSLRVVALTAYASSADRARALAAGFDGYLTKPINIVRFPALVERAIAGETVTE